MVLADRSSALVIEEWVVQVSRFGPKATVSLRGSRAIRAWVVVAVWFGLSTAFGVGAAALLFVFMPRPPEFLPGVVFVAGLIATIVGAQTFARTQANRWALATHKSLGGVAGIMEGKSAAAAYR